MNMSRMNRLCGATMQANGIQLVSVDLQVAVRFREAS
jgi:hypothetical protein